MRGTIYLVCCLFCLGLFAGCVPKPERMVNWFYYTQDGQVVDKMQNAGWYWDWTTAPRGNSAPAVNQTDISLGNPVWPKRTSDVTCTNKYKPSVWVVTDVAGPEGIDSVAITIPHEYKHIWVYTQWRAPTRETGMFDGRMHSDTDAIPDVVEDDHTTEDGIGKKYWLNSIDPDSFDMKSHPEYSQSEYDVYGDNEILARDEGFTNPKTTHPEKDWSQGGKQWRH